MATLLHPDLDVCYNIVNNLQDPDIVPLYNNEVDMVKQGGPRSREHLDLKEFSGGDFLNSVILFYGRNKANLPYEAQRVFNVVNRYVNEMAEKLFVACGLRFNVIPFGSSSEGIKIRAPNEFDFIFATSVDSISSSEIILEKVTPPTFKLKCNNAHICERSQFFMYFTRDVPERWRSLTKCKSCSSVDSCSDEHDKRYLCPSAVQNYFAETISSAICPPGSSSHSGTDVTMKASGPAATFYARCKSSQFTGILKIDITFAVPIRKNFSANWPLSSEHDIKLCSHIENIKQFHVIPCGDFWRISFVEEEERTMKALLKDHNKKYCLQAIKYLRDELSMVTDHESPILSSYPIKVAFMKEALADPGPWPNESLAPRAIAILRRVVEEGSTGEMSSYFIENDCLVPGGQGLYYIEARRILHHLYSCYKGYRRQGLAHFILWLMFLVAQLTFDTSSALMTFDVVNSTDKTGKWNAETFKLCSDDPMQFIFPTVNLAASIVMCVVPLSGLIWIHYNRNIVYELYSNLWRVYTSLQLLAVASFILATLELKRSVELTTDMKCGSKHQPHWCTTQQALPFDILASLSLIIGTVPILLYAFHIVFVFCKGQRKHPEITHRFKEFCCQIVYYDPVYNLDRQRLRTK